MVSINYIWQGQLLNCHWGQTRSNCEATENTAILYSHCCFGHSKSAKEGHIVEQYKSTRERPIMGQLSVLSTASIIKLN